jgi:hypothetical protein
MDAFALFLHTAMPVGTRASSIRDFAAIMVASPASRSALDPLSESGADFAAVPYAVGDAKRGQFISSGDRLCDAAFNCNFISRGSPRKLRCMPHCMGAKACTLAVLSCQSSDKTSFVDVFQSVAQLIPSRATSSLGRSSSVSNRAPLTRRRRYGSKVAAVHSRSCWFKRRWAVVVYAWSVIMGAPQMLCNCWFTCCCPCTCRCRCWCGQILTLPSMGG